MKSTTTKPNVQLEMSHTEAMHLWAWAWLGVQGYLKRPGWEHEDVAHVPLNPLLWERLWYALQVSLGNWPNEKGEVSYELD